jgi:hypothetical protein
MTPKEFNNEVFDLMEINDVEVLFTPNRINRQLVPNHLFVYDIRSNDDNTEDFCTIEKYVQVNHTGTIISKQSLIHTQDFVKITDYNFVGEEKALAEYILGEIADTEDVHCISESVADILDED